MSPIPRPSVTIRVSPKYKIMIEQLAEAAGISARDMADQILASTMGSRFLEAGTITKGKRKHARQR